jgi:hypothetical protein
LHVKPQATPSHVAVAFGGGAGHGEHEEPHVMTLVLFTHCDPHWWNPLLHANPHVVPSHVALALLGGVHGEHDEPQVSIALLLAQALPH